MFECFACHVMYEMEIDAKECCSKMIEFENGDFQLPRKFGKPVSRSHYCPNVQHGGKSWGVFLGVDEKCPMCEYVYRPR